MREISQPLNITASLSPRGSQAIDRTSPPTVTDSSSISHVWGAKSAHFTASLAPLDMDVVFCLSP